MSFQRPTTIKTMRQANLTVSVPDGGKEVFAGVLCLLLTLVAGSGPNKAGRRAREGLEDRGDLAGRRPR